MKQTIFTLMSYAIVIDMVWLFACNVFALQTIPKTIGTSTIAKNVSVIGTGYVGLVAGACLTRFGHNVICADIDKDKIASLRNGIMPIYEPGLKELVEKGVATHHLTFTDQIEWAIREAEIILIAVFTPMDSNGQADLTAVKNVVQTIARNLNSYKIVCVKSTVPIGTGSLIKRIMKEHCPHDIDFDIVSNPEFLREGVAINDFLKPDRVVIGAESEKALNGMYSLYQPLYEQNIPFLSTNIITAETIKYASNTFLATKISFINEISAICDTTGADITEVAQGMGLDKRISPHFLKPGPGYGGSCFPKDTQALLYMAQSAGLDLKVIKAAYESNEVQKLRIFKKLSHLLNNELQGKTVALLGLAFKAETDDVRCSPAIPIIEKLINSGAYIKAYDPMAVANMKKLMPQVTYCNSLDEAVLDVDGIVVLTEWDEFKSVDLLKIRQLVRKPILLDARNIINTKKLASLGFTFDNIGNAQVN
jgi:UDPglucose 6-dehydrogenase